MPKGIILPGDGEKGAEESDPTIVLQEGTREITATTLGDRDAPKASIIRKIAEHADDWGDGFFVDRERVLVQRGPDGSIVRTIPFSQIPGVHVSGSGFVQDDPGEPLEVDPVPTPVPLDRRSREKLVDILAHRLWNYWKDRGPGDPRYNPFRDGIPDLPAGSPEHLQPLPGTELYPATDAQIYQWARAFVADRAKLINTKRFGGNTLQDIALRIE